MRSRTPIEWGLEVEAIAAFFAVALGIEGVAFGDGDDVDEVGAEAFAGFSRGGVVGVAGDPEGFVAVGAGEGEEKAAGAFGVAASASWGEDVVADVAEVEVEVGVVPDAEGDGTDDGDVGELGWCGNVVAEAHPEGVAGNDSAGWIGRSAAEGVLGEEGDEGIARGLSLGGHVASGDGMVAGREDVVDVTEVGFNEFELMIDEREDARGVNEGKGRGLHDDKSVIERAWARQQAADGERSNQSTRHFEFEA